MNSTMAQRSPVRKKMSTKKRGENTDRAKKRREIPNIIHINYSFNLLSLTK